MILTPPGVAAIAVVRIRGLAVPSFLATHCSKPAKLHRCIHADILDGPRVIDDAVVVLCDDTTADINLHGGSWVVKSLLDLLSREGFTLIPGDLPCANAAADYAGLLQQEIDRFLPLAKTELGVRALLAQATAWRTFRPHADDLTRILSDQTLTHLLLPPSVAIVGPANVGKSTLANQLFAQQRSITADIPGTTRDWVGAIANIEGLPVMLLDTPGLRTTPDPIEAAAIHQSRDKIASASLAILVLDVTRPLAGEQAELLRTFSDAIVVLNKSDRPPHPEMKDLRAIWTVATSGHGVDELRAAIVHHFCGTFSIDSNRPRCWTPRQRQIVQWAIDDPAALGELFAEV